MSGTGYCDAPDGDGLVNGKTPDRKPLLNDEQRAALAVPVDNGPQFEVDGTVR
ncbi:hypothetical protein WKW50_24125 [Ochrobactrum sp. GPK 3]